MTVKTMAKVLELKQLAGFQAEDQELKGCYIGDLLSRVIGKAVAGGIWITIMANVNVAAVALLADVACIVLAEDVEPDEDLKEKCDAEGIPLYQSPTTAVELATELYYQ